MIATNPIQPVCNYATNPTYCQLPSPDQLQCGVVPLDSLPAAWWNALWNQTNAAVNEARGAVGVLINEVNTVLTQAGVCVNPSCFDQLYQSIDKIRQTIGTASVAGAVKSSSAAGEVSIDANGIMTANCVGNAALLNTSARTLTGAVNELKQTYDCCFTDTATAVGGKAPIAHAVNTTTYGVGNADCYGHLKISDEYTCCVGSAADGVAASQLSVYCLYQAVSAATSLGNTAGCALGTAAAGTATTAARSDHVHPTTGLATVQCVCGYWGLGYAGAYSDYLRAPAAGFIPYASNADGCGYIGTPSWPFLQMHAKCFYGNVCGNVSGSAASATSVFQCGYTSAYLFDVLLTNTCATQTQYIWMSAKCRLQYCNTTGVLYACCFCGHATSATDTCCASMAWKTYIYSINKCGTWWWSGKTGQPSWLWGGDDGQNFYVYNPSCFCVCYATSAGSATTACCSKRAMWVEGFTLYCSGCCWYLKNKCSCELVYTPNMSCYMGWNVCFYACLPIRAGMLLGGGCSVCLFCASNAASCPTPAGADYGLPVY